MLLFCFYSDEEDDDDVVTPKPPIEPEEEKKQKYTSEKSHQILHQKKREGAGNPPFALQMNLMPCYYSTGHLRWSLTSYFPFSTSTNSERALSHGCTEG